MKWVESMVRTNTDFMLNSANLKGYEKIRQPCRVKPVWWRTMNQVVPKKVGEPTLE